MKRQWKEICARRTTKGQIGVQISQHELSAVNDLDPVNNLLNEHMMVISCTMKKAFAEDPVI